MFFWKRNNLVFIELGNFNIRSSLITKSFRTTKVLQQASCVNYAYKNGIIRNKDLFVSHIEQILRQYDKKIDTVTVGLNSSYINYDCFETKDQCTVEDVAQLIPDGKIINFKADKNRVATLSVNNNFLNKLYTAFDSLQFESIRFVSTDYLKASALDKRGITMVVNIGYKCTNITIFKDDFLIFYKTIIIGAESLVLAVANRFEVSVIESIHLLKNFTSKHDSRTWIECGGKSFNSEHVSNVVSFYIELLANKILQNNVDRCDKIDNCIVTGWATIIPEIDDAFSKHVKGVNSSIESDQLASHLRIKDLLVA